MMNTIIVNTCPFILVEMYLKFMIKAQIKK